MLPLCFGAAPSARSAPIQPAPSEGPLTNTDVARLAKLDLGDEVVIAKINQAKKVDFKLDTDSLVLLKQQGVSKAVIAAMLKRVSGPPAGAGTPASAPASLFSNASDEGVTLRTSQKEIRLQSVLGEMSQRWAYVTTLIFLDFQGQKADTRITDRKPTVIVHSSKSPRGRVFMVKCDPNAKDNSRSVKLGRQGLFSSKSWGSPDSDWTVEFDTREVAENTWEITPKTDLEAGEYGLLFKGGFLGAMDPTRGELFDFGVN